MKPIKHQAQTKNSRKRRLKDAYFYCYYQTIPNNTGSHTSLRSLTHVRPIFFVRQATTVNQATILSYLDFTWKQLDAHGFSEWLQVKKQSAKQPYSPILDAHGFSELLSGCKSKPDLAWETLYNTEILFGTQVHMYLKSKQNSKCQKILK